MTQSLFVYPWPHPAVAADIVVLGLDAGRLHALLIRRGEPPFAGDWALPGGFLKPDETIEASAARELVEETGVHAEVELVGLFSDPERDPRQRVISVAFVACIDANATQPRAGSDAAAVHWHALDDLPPLAFDHASILAAARRRACELATTVPLAVRLLAAPFTLADLQTAQELLLGHPLDKRNFRRDVLARGWVREVDARRTGPFRPAQMYEGA
jgi:8-oxo-dGTP diphosphatase